MRGRASSSVALAAVVLVAAAAVTPGGVQAAPPTALRFDAAGPPAFAGWWAAGPPPGCALRVPAAWRFVFNVSEPGAETAATMVVARALGPTDANNASSVPPRLTDAAPVRRLRRPALPPPRDRPPEQQQRQQRQQQQQQPDDAPSTLEAAAAAEPPQPTLDLRPSDLRRGERFDVWLRAAVRYATAAVGGTAQASATFWDVAELRVADGLLYDCPEPRA